MFLHAKHAVLGGINSINIVSSNTGVVTGLFDCLFVWFWLFFFFDDLKVDEFWMTFGKGNDLQWIPIHYIVRSLDVDQDQKHYHFFVHSHVVI